MHNGPYLIATGESAIGCELRVPWAQLKQLALSRWTLAACQLTILLVSAFDIYLTVKYVHFLPNMELNPVGRWLMGLHPQQECDLTQIAAFITAKFMGNVASLLVIEHLARWKRKIAFSVALGVALCQLALFYFLVVYDPGAAHVLRHYAEAANL